MTAREQNNYDAAAVSAQNKFRSDKIEQQLKQSQIAEHNANATKVPGEIAHTKAETARAYAGAEKDRAEADKAKTLAKDDPQVAQLGEAIARGTQTTDQIPGFSKNKAAIEAYLAEHHPNLDLKSVVMDAGERKQANLARNAIHNLEDIATRLQKRPDLIGKINGLVTQGKEVVGTDDRDLGDIVTALDNYALASTGAHGVKAVAARADAKQAFLNHFKNGPNGVAGAIQAARGSLQDLASAGSPRGVDGKPYVYKQGQAAAVTVQPGEPTAKAADGGTLVVRNGAWVKAQ